ncbi:lactaldehyde dehydrogenase [Methanococcus voltae]|uniref:Lactaldehyde dehydrogenase n=1 Tax=Methanococcus voltae TaxID=2188 RepID=A0A8J7URE3_METVO|nr:lactaldehyde dehydrogenase [Methanococcus voltae]MBP2201703.1 lactaldehyde dehydrogenase [Methanococcus voltae]
MFIDGKWVLRDEIDVINPYDYKVIEKITANSRDETKNAIKVALENKEHMHKLSANNRYKILMRLADAVSNNKDRFVKLLAIDAGKPVRQGRIEVDRSITTLRLSAFYAKELRGETIKSENRLIYTKKEPLGVVGAITPFNYPLNLVVHKIAPAIATGNTIVLHPSSKAPLSAILLTKLIENTLKKMKIPLGVFNLVTGHGEVVGNEIATNENVNMISFTGSVEVGQNIAKNAGMKKIALELGGNNPLIVLEDCDIDKAVENAVRSKFLNSGQVCISVGKVLVHEQIYDEFIEKLVDKTRDFNIGNPLEDSTDMGPLITSENADRVENLIKTSISEGGELITGGMRRDSLISPTIISVKENNILLNVETFGPVLPVTKIINMEHGLELANKGNYGLQAGVFTRDINKAMYIAENLDYGGVMINNSPTFRQENMPFGGVKNSGLGREGIKYTVEEMTEDKTIVIHNDFKF